VVRAANPLSMPLRRLPSCDATTLVRVLVGEAAHTPSTDLALAHALLERHLSELDQANHITGTETAGQAFSGAFVVVLAVECPVAARVLVSARGRVEVGPAGARPGRTGCQGDQAL